MKPALRFTRRYAASAGEVWEAMADPDALQRWLAPPADVDARARLVEPGRVLELDWRRDGEPDSLVRIELAEDAAGTIVVLDHTRLHAAVCMRYFGVWLPRLARLSATLGGERG